MQAQQIKYIVILLTSLIYSTRSVTDVNGTYQVPRKVHDDSREPRANQRIVKLYSGVKREPVKCTEEGFQADPFDCSLFYQCVHSKKGKFFVFRHQCGPGTIFDTEKNICNHPKSTSRRNCDDYQNAVPFQKNENDIVKDDLYIYNRKNEFTTEVDFHKIDTWKNPTTESYAVLNAVLDTIPNISEELPLPLKDNIFSVHPTTPYSWFTSNHETKFRTEFPVTTPLTLKTSKRSLTHQERERSENICTKDGFIGDSENCKLFYRCVNNGRGGFYRYEFSCSDSTVWDDEVGACNHPWAVAKQRCKEQYNNRNNLQSPSELILPKSNKSEQLETTTLGLKETLEQTNINKENVTKNQIQMNYAHLTNKTIYSNNIENVNSTNASINNDSEQTEMIHQNASQINTHPAIDKTTLCSESGFIGDKHDCKKFYRCVDNGKGSFIKYEYTCGDGTAWDQQIEGCNHVWAVKGCGDRIANEVINQSTVSQSLPNYQSTIESILFQTDDSEYSNSGQTKPPSTTTDSVISKPISTTIKSNMNAQICKIEGFFSEDSNCKKFYRCVDNGRGGYIKYEYSCGEGTLFDSSIQACNHAWAVQNCSVSSMENLNDIRTTTLHETLTTISLLTTTTQRPIPNYEYETGHGQSQQNSQSPISLVDNSSITTTTTTKNPIQYLSKCTSSGFMADKDDCKKFYRCVDNGNDNFIRYEFTCGDGTVWDQNIESCNYEWASLNCKYNTTDLHQDTVISTIKPSDQNYTQNEISTISSVVTEQSTQSLQQETSQQQCVQDGFIGDVNDCQKFYRCVSNEKGGYVKYEFFCGDGTIWDENILACNHNSDDKKCNKKQIYPQSTTKKNNVTTNMEISTTTSYTSTTENSINQNEIDVCNSEGFYANSKDCMKFYRCVEDGKGTYFRYDFVCGEDTVWDQEIQACNHALGDKKCTKTDSDVKPENTNTDNQITSVTSATQIDYQSTVTVVINHNNCSTEGFFANKNDCRKFYRCVNNGNGKYTKYDFTCGEGTVWVQEIQACDHDNDVENCSAQNENDVPNSQTNQETSETTSSNTLLISSTSQRPDEENSNESSTQSTLEICTTEGFYPMKNNCKKFYRCVDNGQGGFTKYEFTCGDGTAWDSSIQSCNHISYVENCQSDSNNSSTESNKQEEQHQTTETTAKPLGTSSKPNTCRDEGYYGDSNNCKKFFRCVDNGNGGYNKYEYNCGEGTIWDQDITACNHPQDVANPSCKDDVTHSTSTQSTSTQRTSTQMMSTQSLSTQSSSTHSSTTQEISTQSSTSEESSISEPTSTSSETNEQNGSNNNNTSGCDNSDNKNFTCNKAGYYANPNDCRKFYRCVDWDGNGKRFSIYHFECGEGTIWDPNLETCNYEESIYPPRNCKGLMQNQNTTQETTSTSTTEKSASTTTIRTSTTTQKSTTKSTTKKPTTEQSTTVSQPSTSEKTTTEQTTTQQTTKTTTEMTTSDSTTTEKSIAEQTTTSEPTTQSTTTTDEPTTQQSSTEKSTKSTTIQPSTTTNEPTTEQSSTEKSTTPTTTQSSTTTEEPTIQSSTTSDGSTTQQSSTESTTESSTQESTTIQQTSTSEQSATQSTTSKEESSTQQSTTEQSTTESTTENTTQESTTQQSTTEKPEESSTTTESSNSEKECPETEDDQYLLVCPTSFKRHPKYCNLFYQCTENDDTHEMNVATFRCPNNTIYDERKIQCVEENKAEKKCNAKIAKLTKIKRLGLNNNEPITVGRKRLVCSSEGHFPFERDYECSPAFLKCQNTKLGTIRGIVVQCPPGYVYWSISRRCEQKRKLIDCKASFDNWNNRWNIPFEQKNIAA